MKFDSTSLLLPQSEFIRCRQINFALIFRSFYSSVLVLWERFCALNGVSMLYETSVRLCRHIRDRDLSAAVAWIDYCTRETVSGSRRIYY